VYYELSLRHAITKPVVQLVFGEMRQLPFDVHASRTIPFSFDVREVERARNELDLQINEIHNSGFQASNLIAEVATLTQIGKTGPLEMVDVLKAVQDVAADVRLLAGDVQMLKQRGAAFVSSPTGPSPGNAFISGSSEDMNMFGSLGRAAFSGDGKLAAAGVVYSVPTGPTGR
jgi:hypothetical protein